MTRTEALRIATAELREAGIESPRREARLLLGHALGLDQDSVLANLQLSTEVSCYQKLVNRRCGREPLAYILGKREFWSLTFEVSASTLIPRPESETLIGAALECFPDRRCVRRVLDLGTGTGCLLIAAAKEFADAYGIGLDINPGAAALARRNAARLGVASRCGFVVGDWTAALADQFDLVLCNPPYIRSGTIGSLMPEVAGHEPPAALDGGPDGLAAYRRIFPVLAGLLERNGAAVLEIGEEQAGQLMGLAGGTGLTISLREDLAGMPRALVLRAPAHQKNRLA